MRATASGLLLLALLAGCHRRENAPRPPASSDPTPIATASPSPPAARKDDQAMKPELKRLLAVLRSGSGHRGEVRGTFDDLRRWIGPEAKDWPLVEMLKQLEAAGEIAIHVLSSEAGANPAFVLSAWKD